MKIAQSKIIAHRYAQACMNVFFDQFLIDDLHAMKEAEQYLSKCSAVFFFLRLSAIDNQIKKQALDKFCTQFKLGNPIKKIIELLIKQKRSFLLGDVLHALIELYKERYKIYSFKFICSQKLSHDDEQELKAFLAKETGYDIIYKSIVDEELIAGIRLQSDTLLWENSIRKRLHAIELQFIR